MTDDDGLLGFADHEGDELDDVEDAAPDPEAEAEERKRRRSGRRKVMIAFFSLLLAIFVLAGAALGYYLHRASSAMDKLHSDPSYIPTDGPRPPEPTSDKKYQPVTFVLMGSDSRGADQGRSDSLMVAYLSGDRKKLYLVSFLRDMWVDIPGKGKAKINAAYSWGGPPLTIKTLEQLTGVRMDHAAVIDFPGFVKLTDTLGGVLVYNKQASKTGQYEFPQGWVTVKGESALAYVRERYDLANGDLDRAERQRDVVQAILKKVATPEVVANPVEFGNVMDTFAESVTVDSGLTKGEITKLARQLRLNSATDVVQVQAPISGFGRSADGQAIDIVDEKGLAELSQAMKTDTMDAYVAKQPK